MEDDYDRSYNVFSSCEIYSYRSQEKKMLSYRHEAGTQHWMKGVGQQKRGKGLQRMHTQFLRLVLKKLLDICSLKHSASHLRRWQLQMNRDIFSGKNQLLHKKNFLAASRSIHFVTSKSSVCAQRSKQNSQSCVWNSLHGE